MATPERGAPTMALGGRHTSVAIVILTVRDSRLPVLVIERGELSSPADDRQQHRSVDYVSSNCGNEHERVKYRTSRKCAEF
jgi:hypothetical protein